MNKRPLSVTIISWLFVATGVLGFVRHAAESKAQGRLDSDAVWACGVNLVAVIAGAFMLRGSNWARWLLVAWMAFHIVLSAFHKLSELAVHCALFGVIGYFLFRPAVSAYFAGARAEQTPIREKNP
jgi:hypothetical protein